MDTHNTNSKILKNNWKLQFLKFDKSIDDALQQQHHAAQFIAMVGRYLIEQQSDDSNTNMGFIPKMNLLMGNPLANGMRVALSLPEMKIRILDEYNNTKKVISLEGKTKQKVFNELAQNLVDLRIDVADFRNELHYEIPTHQLDNGAAFIIENKNDFIENANLRHNAEIILNEVAQLFEQEESVRIWPHHFDTGVFFTISRNEKEEPEQTIGIGFSIPDSMISEPYYYLSFWSERPIEGIKNFTKLNSGKWMMPDWNGAVLKHSEILAKKSAFEQYKIVSLFFNQGIELLKIYLKN